MTSAGIKSQIRAVDLFCGVGGLTHGLVKGGVNVVAGIDVDEACRFPYEANNKTKFIKQDISKLKSTNLANLFGDAKFTLLAGCAPCQPFSTYSRGARKVGDSDWELVATFGRLVRLSKPHFVTMENVPQVEHHKVFRDFLANLNGYHVAWETVECEEIGVPQTRKRLVLMASKLGPHGLSLAKSQKKAFTVRDAIAKLPPLAAGESDDRDPLHIACRLSDLNLRRIKASRPGGTWRDWDVSLRAKCHRKATGDTYPSVYGRMEWDGPAPTITTQCFGYGNGRFGHPEQHRAITLREAAMLQTFPAKYKFLKPGDKIKFSALGRLIGNAVPVKLGEAIARAFIQHAQYYAAS